MCYKIAQRAGGAFPKMQKVESRFVKQAGRAGISGLSDFLLKNWRTIRVDGFGTGSIFKNVYLAIFSQARVQAILCASRRR